jgi:hypothetical protein
MIEEAGFLAVGRNQVRLGKALKEPLGLHRANRGAEAFLGVEHEHVEEVAERQRSILLEIGRGYSWRLGPSEPLVLVAIGNERRAELLQRAAAHFREAHAQHDLVRGHALLLLEHVDDVLFLLHVAGGDVRGLLDDVLARDGPGHNDVLAAAEHADVFAREQLFELRDERAQVAPDLHLEGLDRPFPVPHEQGNRPRLLAVHQELGRRGHERVSDVGHGQRHARDRAPDVEHGRPAHHEVDVGAAHGVPHRARRGGRRRRRVEGLRLLSLRRRHQDDDDVHDQGREEGGRPPALLWPRSPELGCGCRDHDSDPPIRELSDSRYSSSSAPKSGCAIPRAAFQEDTPAYLTTSVARLSPRITSTVGATETDVDATVTG